MFARLVSSTRCTTSETKRRENLIKHYDVSVGRRSRDRFAEWTRSDGVVHFRFAHFSLEPLDVGTSRKLLARAHLTLSLSLSLSLSSSLFPKNSERLAGDTGDSGGTEGTNDSLAKVTNGHRDTHPTTTMTTRRDDTLANPERRHDKSRARWTTLGAPAMLRLSLRHSLALACSLARAPALTHPVRRYNADEPLPCRGLPRSPPEPFSSLQLPLERGSSLGWDQYEVGRTREIRAQVLLHPRRDGYTTTPRHPGLLLSLSLLLAPSLRPCAFFPRCAPYIRAQPRRTFLFRFPPCFLPDGVRDPSHPRRHCRHYHGRSRCRPRSVAPFPTDDPHLIVHASPPTYSRQP